MLCDLHTFEERALMSKAIRLMALVATGCMVVAACGSQPKASGPSSTKPPATTSTGVSPNALTSTTTSAGTSTSSPDCVGLSICAPPPPDAEGNPACYFSDGWQATASGAGIEVWYFHEPENMSKPDKVTVVVRKKDGTTESQDANIEAGQQTHRFEFPTIDKSVVQEVLLNSSGKRCFVIGPGS
jgi:hypothetical protein